MAHEASALKLFTTVILPQFGFYVLGSAGYFHHSLIFAIRVTYTLALITLACKCLTRMKVTAVKTL
jgi:hypothetical protein